MSNHGQGKRDQVVAVTIERGTVYLTLADGRIIGNPLDWYPWLAAAAPEQQANAQKYILSADWPDLDDGIDVAEMLKGIPPRLAEKA